jgi:hypothetical protein
LHDIPAWCKAHGHKVLACDEKTDEIVLMAEKDAEIWTLSFFRSEKVRKF